MLKIIVLNRITILLVQLYHASKIFIKKVNKLVSEEKFIYINVNRNVYFIKKPVN